LSSFSVSTNNSISSSVMDSMFGGIPPTKVVVLVVVVVGGVLLGLLIELAVFPLVRSLPIIASRCSNLVIFSRVRTVSNLFASSLTLAAISFRFLAFSNARSAGDTGDDDDDDDGDDGDDGDGDDDDDDGSGIIFSEEEGMVLVVVENGIGRS